MSDRFTGQFAHRDCNLGYMFCNWDNKLVRIANYQGRVRWERVQPKVKHVSIIMSAKCSAALGVMCVPPLVDCVVTGHVGTQALIAKLEAANESEIGKVAHAQGNLRHFQQELGAYVCQPTF